MTKLKRLVLVEESLMKDASSIELSSSSIVRPSDMALEGIMDPGHTDIQIRKAGEFDQLGFYLVDKYDWVLGKDSKGVVVLLAVKRND